MITKRLFAAILSSAMTLSLTACGNVSPSNSQNNTAPTQSAGTDGALRIALCMSHQSNSFTINVASGAKSEAKKLGVVLDVFDGKKSQPTQTTQIEQAIRSHYDGILVEPVSPDGVVPPVQAARSAGIPVITVVQKMSGQTQYAAAYCGGDDVKAGELQMTKVCTALGGKGNIAILYGPLGSDGQLMRKKGYDRVLAKYPKIKPIFAETADWVTEEALSLTENWLQSGATIDAVVAQNDGMAMGALQSVEDAGMQNKVKVYGIDAVDDALAAISAGRLAGTISQNASGQGALGVQDMVDLLHGKTIPPTTYTSCDWVDASNVNCFQRK